MKKALPILLVLIVVGVIWFIASSNQQPIGAGVTAVPPTKSDKVEVATNNSSTTQSTNNSSNPPSLTPFASDGVALSEDDGEDIADAKPAAEAYSSADEAMAAVKNGAKEYDDVILEQFTQPGDDCTWCGEFYKQIKGALAAPETSQDQKSYFAEILAISGKTENIETLVDNIKNAKNQEEADTFAEALELTVGKDDVTKLVGDQMSSTNETLRESSVAAVTNQGSRLAAELLTKNMYDRGDPDGYYSLGIGLGEFIPDEEAIPVLQQVIAKRDQFSHLGVKSLINGGLNGLRILFDELESSKDPENDRKLLKDALDHVNYEDGLDEFLTQRISSSKQPFLTEFAKQIKDEFAQETAGTTDLGDQTEP